MRAVRESLRAETLPADFVATLERLNSAGILERQLAPDVATSVREIVGRYSRFCRASGRPIDMSSETIHAFLKHISELKIKSISRADYIQFFGYFAQRYGVPDTDLEKMATLIRHFKRMAKREPKCKTLKLRTHPMTLQRIFELATAELEKGLVACSPHAKAKHFYRAAVAALLSREPMRRKDAHALVIGEAIVLNGDRWAFDFRTSKNGYLVLVDLPQCLDIFIDFLLDPTGEMDRQTIYAICLGRPLFSQNGVDPVRRKTIANNFKHIIAHSPHIVRTLAHVDLALAGLPGEHALALCGQAPSGASRRHYEVGVTPYRISLAMDAINRMRAEGELKE